ncbi:hypothetical protein D1007_60446 [Hordeum vulgare]|nr:hypothetical protein D1007_60446 [Hordeum vulgare]
MLPAHYFNAVKPVKRHVALGLFKPPIIFLLVSHPHTSPILSHLTVLLLITTNNPKTRPPQACSSPHHAGEALPRRGVRGEDPSGVDDVKMEGHKGIHQAFLALGFGHLSRGSPRLYRVEEVIHHGVVVAILFHFTNNIDVFYLLGRVFWCGSEFIAFTTNNIFADYNNIFSTTERMYTLSYPIDNTPTEDEK